MFGAGPDRTMANWTGFSHRVKTLSMARTPQDKSPRKPAAVDPRALRLKAALKANLGRRKAQARKRQTCEDDGPDNGPDNGE